LKFVNARESTIPKDLAGHLGIDNKIAGNLLGSLSDSGYVAKASRGTYVAVGGETGETGEMAASGLPAISPNSSHSLAEERHLVLDAKLANSFANGEKA
jgi:predicted transcriptional regulator of viral defense system